MVTKKRAPALHKLVEKLQREVEEMRAGLDKLEKIAKRPKVAKVIFPPRTEPGGGTS